MILFVVLNFAKMVKSAGSERVNQELLVQHPLTPQLPNTQRVQRMLILMKLGSFLFSGNRQINHAS